jgi:dienelactone hydrolase
MIQGFYSRWMFDWENRLCSRATNRIVRPFEWGLDWAQRLPVAERVPRNGHDPLEHSDEFFAYEPPKDFKLDGNLLRFRSAAETPHPANNVVHGQWFPAQDKPGRRRVAAVVLPHWNASVNQHSALCAGMAKLGISALRLSLPYHDYRMPAELHRADYAMSANIGRTLDATRQAVIDTRSCADWLESQGFESIGLVGTSIGSCYAYLASSHDPRFRVNVFNHCSTYVADVVWEGLSTQHIKQSLEGEVTLEDLRDAWLAISPPLYAQRYAKMRKKPIFIYTRYDTTFPVRLSEQVIAGARQLGYEHKVVVLPCGHYTMGETPFKFFVGYHIINFLKRNL